MSDQHVYRGFVVRLTNGDELRFFDGHHHYALREGGALQIMMGDHCEDVMLIAQHEWKLVKPVSP